MLWQRGKAYSQDLRERVLARADRGDRVGQIARALQVSVSYVSKVLSRRRETGETAARPQCNHVPPKLADLHDAIRGQVAAKPDATLAELRAWLTAEHKATASDALMCKTMRTLDLTRKKSRCAPANRIARMSPRRARNGARGSRASSPASWCSSTRPGPGPT
jgi:transposase